MKMHNECKRALILWLQLKSSPDDTALNLQAHDSKFTEHTDEVIYLTLCYAQLWQDNQVKVIWGHQKQFHSYHINYL